MKLLYISTCRPGAFEVTWAPPSRRSPSSPRLGDTKHPLRSWVLSPRLPRLGTKMNPEVELVGHPLPCGCVSLGLQVPSKKVFEVGLEGPNPF